MTTVLLEQLVGNADNPRDELGALDELAASIKAVGLLQPLLVVPNGRPADERYMVVDGHRRFAAMRSIEYQLPIPVVVTPMDRTQRLVAAIAAGAFTRKLSTMERARAFRQLRDELGLTQTEIAKRVGCSQATVNTALRLFDLDDSALADVAAGRMSHQQAITQLRTTQRRPQGRKKRIPNPNEHQVDIKLVLTVTGSTDDHKLADDIGRWFELQHARESVPHSGHILTVDDWGANVGGPA